ncbi:MAG: beta-ketoacyl-ACP synthase II [Burkholderiaceae bacterium]|nr:beta-ketoacyl-ACP synthase II [Burkholderiaceae bacterium]
MSRRRVAITGLGIVSPVGNDVATAWGNLVAGRSGVSHITRFDVSAFPTRIAGEVRDFNVAQYMSPKEARHFDTFVHYGIAAGLQALRDSGIQVDEHNAERIGVIIGSGIGGLPLIEDTHAELVARGVRRVSPFFVPGSIINMISGQMSIMGGLKGPNYAIVSACTTGLHCIGDAARLIIHGDADAILAGGSEATISPLGLGGFCAARALSTRNDDPATASRPWDRDRDGFVLGEGAGVLMLEEYEHARRRGATIYAEVIGFGMSADAHHITAPDMDGPRRCMLAALRDAGVAPGDIDYLNAHGTSTPLGDRNETEAIKAALGDSAARGLVVNSTKSMTGHLLGGAGGIETVFTALAIHHQVSPPTINIFEQDPECDLDYCANTARDVEIEVAMKNSFGFGGTNGTLVLRRV